MTKNTENIKSFDLTSEIYPEFQKKHNNFMQYYNKITYNDMFALPWDRNFEE